MFEKNLNVAYLLDFYGEVLTDRAREMLEMYFCDDMSLSEIADAVGISRQGARQAIKKGEEELRLLEEKLSLAAKHKALKHRAEDVLALLSPDMAQTELGRAVTALTDAVFEKNDERED
ncbi:MAG: hypothetical protein IJV96_06695 [Clostridia bacterium]|nr:hypothetical protein [Clostridia bacterium]